MTITRSTSRASRLPSCTTMIWTLRTSSFSPARSVCILWGMCVSARRMTQWARGTHHSHAASCSQRVETRLGARKRSSEADAMSFTVIMMIVAGNPRRMSR